jgi:hypothetical protein
MDTKDLNRLKTVLVEEKRTSLWITEQLGVDLRQLMSGNN